jgi:hypothetical protein
MMLLQAGIAQRRLAHAPVQWPRVYRGPHGNGAAGRLAVRPAIAAGLTGPGAGGAVVIRTTATIMDDQPWPAA